MTTENNRIFGKRLAEPYMWLIIAAGAVVWIIAARQLSFARLDLRFLLLAVVTIATGTSHIVIKIPRFDSQISISDTFVFLTLLLYGGEAAILLAGIEAFCSSARFCNKKITVFFNAAVLSCSTALTVAGLRLAVGSDVLPERAEYAITAICLMAIVQYIANSGFVSIAGALKSDQPVLQTWYKHYLWTSITYFAGASAAAIIVKLINVVGFYAFIVTAPIIAIVYFTYLTYLKNVESSIAQAHQAERHVEELSHYIAEQERIREQFSQIEKLSALGELASGVAHDFNNTLAGILGRAQLLQRTNDPEKIKRGLEIIIKTAQDGAKTVKRIQDFARQRRDHDFEPLAVDQLLFDVSEITRPRWKDRAEAANVHISLDIQINCKALIMGDDSELREVLVNMVFNAVDAMPEGGKLTLATNEAEDHVEICVGDTGVGMSPEVRSRIFDPFFTTKGKAGLGLGLAVSYGIVSRHEGTFEVDSEVGSGTTFRIKLPKAKQGAVFQTGHAPETPVSALPHSKQTRILIVDDEEPVRELLRDILENDGYAVAVAESGREALALFERGGFDALFTDIGMPGMSGWELAHAVRERNDAIPIAVITGWGEAVGSNEQKSAKVDWVLTKPFTAQRIIELAREVYQRRHGMIKTAAFTVERAA